MRGAPVFVFVGVEGASGMFGMVSTLIVEPEKAHVDAIVNALIS